MSHNLEIPESVYDALEKAAAASGTTPVGWIAAHLTNPEESISGVKEHAIVFPIWSPYDSFEAAQTLQKALEDDRTG